MPAIDRMVRVSLRTVTLNVPPQDVITRDNVTARVDAVVYFRVVDPNAAVVQVESFLKATSQIAQTTLRSRARQGRPRHAALRARGAQRGAAEDHRRADRAVGREGHRRSRSRTSASRRRCSTRWPARPRPSASGARRSSTPRASSRPPRGSREAADVISQNPTTMQLRYLQTLSEIGVNQNSTVVFPLPIDLVKPLLDAARPAPQAPAQAELPRGNGTTPLDRDGPVAVAGRARSDKLAARNGSTRISGQAAVRPPWGAGAQRRPRHHRRGGRRRGRRDRLSLRRQGAGADRRPRQGRRHQGREGPRGGRGARKGDPRHGHQGPHRPRGVDRGGVGHRRRVLRVDRLRPLRQAPAGHALHAGRHGHRGGGRHATRTRSPACTSTRCSASRTSTPAGSRSRPASTPTSSARSARC